MQIKSANRQIKTNPNHALNLLPWLRVQQIGLTAASKTNRTAVEPLCLSALIEAVRDQARIVDLKQVNRVLIQPHWRKNWDNPIA